MDLQNWKWQSQAERKGEGAAARIGLQRTTLIGKTQKLGITLAQA
jgi:hypothetical protein